MIQNFSLADLAGEFLGHTVDLTAAPAVVLANIYETFVVNSTIGTAAIDWTNGQNDCSRDQGVAEDDLIDASEFRSALEDAINDECESQLDSLEVPEELESAKAAVQLETSWKDYAKDAMSTIRNVAEIAKETV